MTSAIFINFFLLALLFLAIGFAIIIWVNKKEKNQLEEMLTELPIRTQAKNNKKTFVATGELSEFLSLHIN